VGERRAWCRGAHAFLNDVEIGERRAVLVNDTQTRGRLFDGKRSRMGRCFFIGERDSTLGTKGGREFGAGRSMMGRANRPLPGIPARYDLAANLSISNAHDGSVRDD
jgi:hypothetical protein